MIILSSSFFSELLIISFMCELAELWYRFRWRSSGGAGDCDCPSRTVNHGPDSRCLLLVDANLCPALRLSASQFLKTSKAVFVSFPDQSLSPLPLSLCVCVGAINLAD